ncbi:DUF6311 domain-containing protein [Vibrio sp. 10N.261.46.E11]|uniref:DUF6311 domain-containing protein n=1 Tax=Vibrio sp. 10N.261.46.E11 TaxID=3229662 RepID=UPI00354ECFF1
MENSIIKNVNSSNTVGALAIVISCVLLFLFLFFPEGFITGTSEYWKTENGDITQYVSGFNSYFKAPWSWPLLAFDSFNYPEGTRATFVDIIPAYSLALKVLVPESFFPFNPFGYWVALSFLMQGVAAWWILKELKINSWAALIAVSVMFVLSPTLMARLGHISLMTHWLLLFSFALYIRSTALDRVQFKVFIILLTFSFYINIYLFVMCFSIYVATILHLWNQHDLREKMLFFVFPVLILFLTMLITLLPFPLSGISKDWGFGYYSMNILSPITGGDLIKINGMPRPGQGEGFNYLGLGVLVLFIWAVSLDKKNNYEYLLRHKSLLALLVLFTVYSLSNQVYWGNVQIATIEYPNIMDKITSQFRASGRFFWPVGYAIVIYSVVIISRRTPKLVGALVLLIFTVIQTIDLNDRLDIFSSSLAKKAHVVIDPKAMDSFFDNDVSEIYFYPKFRCPTKSSTHNTLLPLMKYVSERGMKMNTGYIARHAPPCTGIKEEVAAVINNPAAFVFVQEDYVDVKVIEGFFPAGIELDCILESKMHICQVYKRHDFN